MATPTMVATAERLGLVEEYVLARFAPTPDHMLTCSEAFEDYRRWCVEQSLAPLREGDFVQSLTAIAREVGITPRQRGSNLSFLDTGLRDANTAG